MDYTIEPAQPNDAEATHRYLNSIFASRPDVLFLRPEGIPLEKVSSLITESLDSKDKLFLLARSGHEVLGTLTFSRHTKSEMTHCGEFGMSVHPDHRRKGIGSKLIEKIERWAEHNDLEKIELQVWSNNIPGISLYNKLGYQVEGIRKRAIVRDGQYRDIFLMAKLIGQQAHAADAAERCR